MIPVVEQPEPASFDEKVRQKGLGWLERHGIPRSGPLPPKTQLEPYWRQAMDDLHRSYDGICAYLCVFIERCTGGLSTDHYIAKSQRLDLAYEWSNYRLACTTMNSKKRAYEDVLDPFTLTPGTFRLELVEGRIYPNPTMSPSEIYAAQATIDRLDLDGPLPRDMRKRRFDEAVANDVSVEHLRRNSPFIWHEMERQGLL